MKAVLLELHDSLHTMLFAAPCHHQHQSTTTSPFTTTIHHHTRQAQRTQQLHNITKLNQEKESDCFPQHRSKTYHHNTKSEMYITNTATLELFTISATQLYHHHTHSLNTISSPHHTLQHNPPLLQQNNNTSPPPPLHSPPLSPPPLHITVLHRGHHHHIVST